jgi:hypothetical protein
MVVGLLQNTGGRCAGRWCCVEGIENVAGDLGCGFGNSRSSWQGKPESYDDEEWVWLSDAPQLVQETNSFDSKLMHFLQFGFIDN